MGAVATAAAEFFTSDAVATAATSAVVGAGVSSALAPKAAMPEVKPLTSMPDPLEQQKARERSLVEQLSRRGRSASILTQPGGGAQTLGG